MVKKPIFCLTLALFLILVSYPAFALASPRGQRERHGFCVEANTAQRPPETPVNTPPLPGSPAPLQRNLRSGGFMPAPAPAPVPSPTPMPAVPTAPSWMTAAEAQAFMLLNQYRTANGIPPVQAHQALTEVARLKARDMSENNYFAHNSPTYGSPGNMVRHAGIKFSALGENLSGAGNVQQAHAQLVYSMAHRQIMLNPGYHYVGIGIVPWKASPGIVMVQLFVKQ